MGLIKNDTYYKITNVHYIETDINGIDEVHIYAMLEFYNERGGELEYKAEQSYIVDADDFDKDGNVVAQVYKIAKKNNLYDMEDVFEEGQQEEGEK